MSFKREKQIKAKEIRKKTRIAFNKLASNYEKDETLQEPRKCYAPVLKIIKKQVVTDFKLLDIGCGTGVMLKMVCEEFPQASDILGIDISPAMVKRARDKLSGYKAYIMEGEIEAADLPKEFYDIELCMHSIHHYPSPLKSLKKMERALSKNGILIIADNYYKGWRRIKRNWELYTNNYPDGDVWMYSFLELGVLAKLAGFKKSYCHKVGKKSFIFVCQK